MAKDFLFAEDYKSLIPDSSYEVQCLRYDSKFHLSFYFESRSPP